MQASPNVSHYYAMIEKYRNKAKDKKFDEIFRSQYPEHSELVHKGEADRTERRLKTNLIRALAVGAGFDEVLVRSSTIQAKYDRFHAAYQLLCAKLLHFKRSQQLRQFVEEVFLFKTGDHGEQHHRGLVHTVSNMLMVSSQHLSEQLEDISFYSDIWKSTAEPNELELKLALFILRADEDAILSHLGVQTSHWVNSVAPGVRRHTVQLPTSPLTFPRLTPTTLTGATTEPNVERGVKSPIPTGVAPVQNPVNATDTVGNTAPRTVPHQFSRQYTQPPLIGSLLVSGQFRTGLQWTTNLSSSGAKGLSFPNSSDGTEEITDNRTSKRPINLPSLELGQEAATTKPPSHVLRFRSNFRRHDPVQESTIEEPIHSAPIVSEDTLASVASQASCLTGVSNSYNLPDIPFHPLIPQLLPDACLMYMSSWDHTIRDGACLGALSGSNPEHGNLPASMDTAAMETETTDCPSQPLNPLSCWPNSSIGPDDDNGATSDAHGLGVLLPQLNLPANLPAVIHQPVARFTVKDPHLLAPPGFMIPHCSSFPRRSSDGAADLQPLHRPVLTVGGSYPEQANYRSKPSASEKDTDALSGSVIVQPASDVDTPHLSTATQASECASHTATKAPRDPLIRSTTARSFDTSSYPNKHPRHVLRFSHSLGFKLRGSSAVSYRIPTGVLAAQHRTLCTALRATRTCTSTTRSWWRPPGRRWTADQSDGDSESFVAGPNSLDADPQVSRYQKRFSLPNTSRFISSFVSHDANATSRLAECICHFPLGPDAINQIQNILSQLSVCYSAYSEHFQSPHVVINEVMWAVEGKTVGHGSENSQLLTWKRRSDQHSHSTSPNSTHGTGSIGDRMAESTSDTTNLEVLHPNGSSQYQDTHPLPMMMVDTLRPIHADSLPLNKPPATPPGIELDELKTELHKLESEGQATVLAQNPNSEVAHTGPFLQCSQLQPQRLNSPSPSAASSLSGSGDANDHPGNRVWRFRRSVECPAPSEARTSADSSSPFKVPRRASSAVSGSAVRCIPAQSTTFTTENQCSLLNRRHRYSIGDCLNYAQFENSELCQPSAIGLHSPSPHYPRFVATTLCNRDHACFDGFHTPAAGVHVSLACDLERTALSSPGPCSVATAIDFSAAAHPNVTSHCPTGSAPSSSGVKRRLLSGVAHQKQQQQSSHDYLHGLQHACGSLDRRLNLDLFTGPKRKIYHDWLPKIAAFSRKAAAAVFQAVTPTQRLHESHSSTAVSVEVPAPHFPDLIPMGSSSAYPDTPGSTLCRSASGPTRSSTGVSLVSICQASDVDDPEDDEEERASELGPLHSQFGFFRGSTFQNTYLPTDTFGLWSSDPGFQNPATPFMFMAAGDDGDDLAEIERVNQQLAMSGGVDAVDKFHEPTLQYGCPSFGQMYRHRHVTTLMPPSSDDITPEHITSHSSPVGQPSP